MPLRRHHQIAGARRSDGAQACRAGARAHAAARRIWCHHTRSGAHRRRAWLQALAAVDECAEADLRWHASLRHKASLSLEILGEAEAALRHTATAAQQLKFLLKQVRRRERCDSQQAGGVGERRGVLCRSVGLTSPHLAHSPHNVKF